MDQEIKKLEALKQQEILLLQQIYEKKINYVNTKIIMLTEESKKKDLEIEILRQPPSQRYIDNPIQFINQNYIDDEKQRINNEKEKELQHLKTTYQQDLQSYHQQMRNRDQLIHQMRQEIALFQKLSSENLDNQKVQFLSQIIDVTNELLVQL